MARVVAPAMCSSAAAALPRMSSPPWARWAFSLFVVQWYAGAPIDIKVWCVWTLWCLLIYILRSMYWRSGDLAHYILAGCPPNPLWAKDLKLNCFRRLSCDSRNSWVWRSREVGRLLFLQSRDLMTLSKREKSWGKALFSTDFAGITTTSLARLHLTGGESNRTRT